MNGKRVQLSDPTVPDASHPLTSRGILIQSSSELSKWKCQLRKGSPAKKLIIKTNDGLSRPSCREKHHMPALFLATGPLGVNHIFSFRISPHPQFHARGKNKEQKCLLFYRKVAAAPAGLSSLCVWEERNCPTFQPFPSKMDSIAPRAHWPQWERADWFLFGSGWNEDFLSFPIKRPWSTRPTNHTLTHKNQWQWEPGPFRSSAPGVPGAGTTTPTAQSQIALEHFTSEQPPWVNTG